MNLKSIFNNLKGNIKTSLSSSMENIKKSTKKTKKTIGRKKLHIFVNVSKDNLKSLLKGLPALKQPTISLLSNKKWYSVNTIIEKDTFLRLLPTLRKLTQGLVVYEPRQVLPLDSMQFQGDE